MKDRLTFFVYDNASDDHKMKPLKVYHSEIANSFSRKNVTKSKLCTMWRAKKRV